MGKSEDLLWSALGEKYRVRRQDPASWAGVLVSGMQSYRSHPVLDPIAGSAVSEALDQLLGVDRWARPRHWGQFLITFPTPGWQ